MNKEHLNIDYEVTRLIRHKRKVEVDIEVLMIMDYSDKIDVLALGMIDGWYGDELVAPKILKNLYEPVLKRAKERTGNDDFQPRHG